MSSNSRRLRRFVSPFTNVSSEVLEVRLLLSSTSTPPPVITPTIDVLTPPNFLEGDVFTVTVMDAAPGKWAGIDVVGDNDTSQCHFPSAQIDSHGNATLPLRSVCHTSWLKGVPWMVAPLG